MPAEGNVTEPSSGVVLPAKPVVVGLGPHGERAASPELIGLSSAILDEARKCAFKVAVLLHTTESDWAKRQVDGVRDILSAAGASLTHTVDCKYDIELQREAIDRLVAEHPDAVIAIPIGSGVLAEAFGGFARAGIKLVLLDNAPSGLLQSSDYVSVVSADNFGLGEIAAELLAPHIFHGGRVCILSYRPDFFATAQREIAFRRWVKDHRSDIRVDLLKFEAPGQAGHLLRRYLDGQQEIDGIFVVWDEPAAVCIPVLNELGMRPAVVTVDLGEVVAQELIAGHLIKGVAAQRPYEQGQIAATAAIAALLQKPVPSWIALPGLPVTSETVHAIFKHVGRSAWIVGSD
jgi:ribose transport system substrate-binding protein